MTTFPAAWRTAFAVYGQRPVLAMLFLGFSAGLPYLLVFSTLSAWLRDEGVTRTVIGFFSWVGVTYSLKVLWAPVIDRVPVPLLTQVFGKRRSWMLLAQTGIIIGLAGMATVDVHNALQTCALLAVWVAFCSATQDVAIDAYRIESAGVHYQGAMAASYVLGYRIALLIGGAGALFIAEYYNWSIAYLIMATTMLMGIITTLCLVEPPHPATAPVFNGMAASASWLERLLSNVFEAVISPFIEFFQRNGKLGILILALIALYKMSDMTMGVMTNPFYLDLGFTKAEIAEVSKIFGFVMTIAGAALGGLLVVRYGITGPLLLGVILAASTNLLFAGLALVKPNLWLLASVVSADNLSGGIATSVFIAYLSSLTSSAYTATQYALFSSLMTLPAQLLGGFSGVIVDHYGYFAFFVYSAALGLPATLLVLVLMHLKPTTVTKNRL